MPITDVYHNDGGNLSTEYVAVRKCWVKQFKFGKGSLEARECNADALLKNSNFCRLLKKEGLFRMKNPELKKLIDQVFGDFVEESEVFLWPNETEWTMITEVLEERKRSVPSSPPKTIRRSPRRRRTVVVPAAVR